VTELIAAGGLVRNEFLMQLYADVCRRPLSVIASDQGPAVGSAIHAAVAAGQYSDVRAAAQAMGKVRRAAYVPDAQRAAVYDALYDEYRRLHDYFGRDGNDVLHRLRALRRATIAGSGRLDAKPAVPAPDAAPPPLHQNHHASDQRAPRMTGVHVPQQSRRHERGGYRPQRERVADLHAELVRYGLVTWTSGNISERLPDEDLFLIKGSGVSYDELTWEEITVCDLHGNVVDGVRSASSDTAAHAYVYRHMPAVNGVVHTHSPYATAWSARGEEIPCVLTAMADEFGGPIPVGPFALIGNDSIGQGIVATLSNHRSPAVLMRSHGVFTIGRSARDAVKAAVMCEDVARTVHLARQLGDPIPLEPAAMDLLYLRYQNVYGQR
jgi:L-ribulose-5-phosphate 4-epimerase